MTKLLPLFAIVLLTSCGQSEMSLLSDSDLRSELSQCANNTNPSRRKAIACGNYTRECEKRDKKSDGGWNC